MSVGTFKVSIYCLCGASMKASGAGNLVDAEELQSVFWSMHTGEIHGPADAKEAAKARRKFERQMVAGESL